MTEPRATLESALAGRYSIEREIARGTVSTVYLARDERHGRPVAMKVYHAVFAGGIGCERFLAEVQITAGLQHPHILPLLDSGSADGLPFYVMPYVEGESLRERLMREGQLPLEDAVRIARDVADALEHAHRAGVIHRDIKPENILLSDGHAVVADFGIARALRAAGGDPWRDVRGSTGTAAYMSPEQIQERGEPDARWDVYSLGATLYEMLAGRPPFVGPSPDHIIEQQLSDEPGPIQRFRSSVPPELAAAIHRALAKNAADRFATAADFSAALPHDLPVPIATVGASATGGKRAEHQQPGVVAGLLAVIALLLVLFAWRLSTATGPEDGPLVPSVSTGDVAVMPFEDLTPGFGDGGFGGALAFEIHAYLAEIPGIRVVPRRAVLALPDSVVTPSAIASILGADFLVDGAIRRLAGRTRVTVEIIDAATGAQLWASTLEAAGDADLLELQETAARAVADALRDRIEE